MAEIFGIEKLLSIIPKGKFGRFCKFGTSQFGHTNYADDDIIFPFTLFGDSVFGVDLFANFLLLSGIYRTDNVSGYTRYYREPYYITKNPRYENQQINRTKFGAAVSAWQGLTSEQKQFYNNRAIGKDYSGYNLFLREYLLSLI